MQLDQNQLQKLLAFLAESDIQEFRLEGNDFRLEVRRNLAYHGSGMINKGNISSSDNIGGGNHGTTIPISTGPSVSHGSSIGTPKGYPNLVEISAPMVGTFYRAPAPGEPSFIELGSHVNVGQTVCILEAMKLMNELEAEVNGVVMEILVDDGTPVEFGQVLMRVSPE
uniref:Biotin carboxyl carrier protein of acetyl-CoA carboxylase n=1 Tax=Paulinella micropora TaxID=1928728 RepID=A0A1S6YI34_9EUKA|nr:acetyl-CoA carboxylase, biotin carboxyl carrier protein [Paulinella micropora]